ncbi:MAG: XdhC family protein [Oscillospiraceae bacterium]
MIQDVLAFAQQQVEQGRQVALVTVTETEGSSPASAGQMMAVLSDGSAVGTVGGGTTEFRVIQQAVEAMKNGGKTFPFAYDHAEAGMVCGGGMRGFGNVLGNENHLYIFGGGHVGQSLAPLAVNIGFHVTVIEDRPELESAFSRVQYKVCKPEDYEKEIAVTGSAYGVICTRGHQTDDEALRFCLGKPFRYTGMIGSRKKVGALFGKLREEGYSEDRIKTIFAPIGLDIASSIPAEIAVSILAEILLIKNNGTAKHKCQTV